MKVKGILAEALSKRTKQADEALGEGGVSAPTKLSPAQEDLFKEWYSEASSRYGLNPDPDHPDHMYDYRGAWLNKVNPSWQPEHKQFRWDDRFKMKGYNKK